MLNSSLGHREAAEPVMQFDRVNQAGVRGSLLRYW